MKHDDEAACDSKCNSLEKMPIWGVYEVSTSSYMEGGGHVIDRTFADGLSLGDAVQFRANLDVVGWRPGSHDAPSQGFLVRNEDDNYPMILATVEDDDDNLEEHLEGHAERALEAYWERYALDEFDMATAPITSYAILVGDREEIEESLGDLWNDTICVVAIYDTTNYEDDDDAIRDWVATSVESIYYDCILRWPENSELALAPNASPATTDVETTAETGV